MSFVMKIISSSDNLRRIVEMINIADWDEGNAIQEYTVDSLRAYLEKSDTLFLACFQSNSGANELAGMASGRFEQKPYDRFKWLYIDEIDTCVNFRRQGVGTAMMRELLLIAHENNCEEVWLGTEKSNAPANKFYQSLHPSAVDAVIGYTFAIELAE